MRVLVRTTNAALVALGKSIVLGLVCFLSLASVFNVEPAGAQEYWPRHYPPYNAANPRPDLLPRGLYNAWVPYRAAYNRPTYLGGLAAHVIEPTSQEAMSWEENVVRGYYGTHCPTPVRTYYYPKPWEVLLTGPRPSGENSDQELTVEPKDNDLVPENPNPAVQRY